MKTIGVSEQTHRLLNDIGKRGETMDDIIKKCIEAYKKSRGLHDKDRSDYITHENKKYKGL